MQLLHRLSLCSDFGGSSLALHLIIMDCLYLHSYFSPWGLAPDSGMGVGAWRPRHPLGLLFGFGMPISTLFFSSWGLAPDSGMGVGVLRPRHPFGAPFWFLPGVHNTHPWVGT